MSESRAGGLRDTVAETNGTLSVQVVGAGTVGSATGMALEEWGHDVVFKDIDAEVREELSTEGYHTAHPERNLNVDLSLVSVPTPYDSEAGELVVDYVEAAVETLAEQDAGIVAVRSTVPPGTTERLARRHGLDRYAMVPEFLFAATADEDVLETDRIILGCSGKGVTRTLKRAFDGSAPIFVETTPTEAEFVKLASNCYAATKISFANELWRIMHEAEGDTGTHAVNPDTVLAAFRVACPWTGPERGLEGGWPYGGHCLPKDTAGMYDWAEDNDIPMPQLAGTIDENERIDRYAD